MNLLFLITCVLAAALAEETETQPERQYYDLEKAPEYFDNFITTHEKTYDSRNNEKEQRLEVFKNNLKIINELNAYNESVYGITEFADLSAEEFFEDCLGEEDDDSRAPPCQIVTDSQVTGAAPTSLDYTKKSAVTPVRSQGKCKSCWAFTSVGGLEAAYAIKHGQLLELAPKQLMDCLACSGHCRERGSTMRRAFAELIGKPGVMLEKDYPYEAKDTPCQFKAPKAKVKVTSCTNFRLNDEAKLKQALAKYGPIGIGIDVKPLQHYVGGIVDARICPPSKANHAVLLVGYGTEKGKDYWLIKNSHGTKFGEKGYMRLLRGQNVCGMLNSHAAAATVA